ncbi:NAD(P)/FAD-dependent oxidoreductase [Acutalibacter caecimuris]|uniref:NAD(P)/FAD-dependent oxidoreductase n=1 Tax=Acutalibacter caecimuris TaxID=3093657 RepID=UPI002AC8A8EC|nr:hypothetical protein [Acutalibacter sp. M00118]
MLRVNNLHLPLGFTGEDLRRAAAQKLRVRPQELQGLCLVKKSVDARKKADVHVVCSVEAQVAGENRLLARLRGGDVQPARPYRYRLPQGPAPGRRPVVVGFGPAGMFAGLILAQCGQRPIILERGLPVEARQRSVEAFWAGGALDPESNVQFGEGGAGAFSDGKLTTGTGDGRIRKVLEELAAAGAPPEILTDAKPHIGTDRLPGVVRNIRESILAMGGEVRFSARLAGLQVRDGALEEAEVATPAGVEHIPCNRLILAVGHSARDVFALLEGLGAAMEPKPFSVGVRVEHPALLIDQAQYGSFAGHPALGAADYKLNCRTPAGRGVYTFCMCPGGTVTGAASELGGIVTNGMSPFARDGQNSNAALLVGVGPEDFGGSGPLAGVAFQRRIERAAFALGGGDYRAPAQRIADLLEGRPSRGFGGVTPTYRPGVTAGDLAPCLPAFVVEALRQALPQLGRRLKGFDLPDGVLTAPETRSSSPVRVLRNQDSLQALGIRGLYPCGEGAGYAGGIVSAAVDGIRCAERCVEAAP